MLYRDGGSKKKINAITLLKTEKLATPETERKIER